MISRGNYREARAHSSEMMTAMTCATAFFVLAATFIAGCFPTCAFSEENVQALAWYDGLWPHERYDIPQDPRIVFGRLENGLRYALVRSDRPKGCMSVQLGVQAGSLMEEKYEQGLAHFLEHLACNEAFKGIKADNAMKPVPFSRQHGMNFIRYHNAYTTLHETVYRLNIDSTDEMAVQAGLDILGHVAGKLNFVQSDIDNEKDVILAEKRDGENEATLSELSFRKFLHGDSPFALDAIGTAECIMGATVERIQRFYRKWYRPDRMIVVVAGDADPKEIEPLVKTAFSGLKKSQAPLPFPALWEREHEYHVFVQKRPVDHTTVSLTYSYPGRHMAEMQANEKTMLADTIALICLRQRLLQSLQKNDGPWMKVDMRGFWWTGLMPSISLSATCTAENWQNALAQLEQEKTSIAAYGFSESEVAMAKKQLEDLLRRTIADECRRSSESIAAKIITDTNNDYVIASPQYLLERYQELVLEITVEDIHRAIQDAFSANPVLHISGNMEASHEVVEQLWSRLCRRTALRHAEDDSAVFPYLPLPPKTDILPTLKEKPVCTAYAGKAFMGELPGGTRLHLIPASSKGDGNVYVSLIFGHPTVQLDDKEHCAANMATALLNLEGPGALSLTDADRLLKAKGIRLHEEFNDYGAVIAGECPAQEIEKLLLALWTQYADPCPEPAMQRRYQRYLGKLQAESKPRSSTVDGMDKSMRFSWFCGGARRFMPIGMEQGREITLDEVKKAVASMHGTGIRDILVTGDFEVQNVLPMLTRLFSGMAPQSPPGKLKAFPEYPAGKTKFLPVNEDPLDKAIVRKAWRADVAPLDRRSMIARSIVVYALRDRLFQTFRVKLGASYSPKAHDYQMEACNGFGFFMAEVTTSGKRINAIQNWLRDIERQFISHGIRERELQHMRKALFSSWKDKQKDDRYQHMVQRKVLLTWLPYDAWDAEYGSVLESLTAREVSKQASAIFSGEKAVLIIHGRERK